MTYIHNEEVQPAPCVCEVGLESISHPLQEHLNNEHVGEYLISIFQDDFYGPALLNVYVFKSLWSKRLWTAVSKYRMLVICVALKEGITRSHQSAAAHQDHEDDEGLKVVVLHNEEACLPEVPPSLSFARGDVKIKARASSNAFYQRFEEGEHISKNRQNHPCTPSTSTIQIKIKSNFICHIHMVSRC